MNNLEKPKKQRKQSTFTCDCCGTTSTKDTSELNRNLRLGRKNYCNLSCSAIANNKTKTFEYSRSEKNLEHLKTLRGSRRDEFTPFRYIYRIAKRRWKKEFNITLQDLKDVWELQNGKCVYSKVSLVLPEETQETIKDHTIRASLDRIDSSKGYIKGNIQFVSTVINYMKNDMSHERTIAFIQTMINNLSLDKD